MEASKVYKSVQMYFDNHEHKWLNKYIFKSDWESDFFCVSKSNYCIEVEVKVSRSDFMADFKKDKHNIFKAIISGGKYYIERKGAGYEGSFIGQKQNGRNEYADCSRINIHTIGNLAVPNKFWYAVPEGLIEKKDVPSYAGLIYAIYRGDDVTPYYKVIKPAPFIHKRILDIKHLLFDKYFWDRTSMQREIIGLKRALSEMNKLRERDSVGILKAS